MTGLQSPDSDGAGAKRGYQRQEARVAGKGVQRHCVRVYGQGEEGVE